MKMFWHFILYNFVQVHLIKKPEFLFFSEITSIFWFIEQVFFQSQGKCLLFLDLGGRKINSKDWQ